MKIQENGETIELSVPAEKVEVKEDDIVGVMEGDDAGAYPAYIKLY